MHFAEPPKPVNLGPNVTRWDQDSPAPWNDFFRTASDVFDVPTNKVMPFDAEISTGNASAVVPVTGAYGATIYGGQEGPSRIAIADEYDPGEWAKKNTAYHEYMHNIEKYFGDYPTGTFGQSSDYAYKNMDWDDYYDYAYKFGMNPHPHSKYASPAEKWMHSPEIYNNELATSLTGYGGEDAAYELQMMQDSWDKRGPANQWTLLDEVNGVSYDDARAAAEKQFEGRSDSTVQIIKAMQPYYQRDNRQRDALAQAFIDNPRNDRLGDAKAPLAKMIAQTLADPKYQINLNEKYYNRYTGDPISTTKDIVMRNQDGDMIDRDGNVTDDILEATREYYTGYGSRNYHQINRQMFPEVHDSNVENYDMFGDYVFEDISYPDSYLNSIEERFARLGAQYMKQDTMHGNQFEYDPSIETDFRKGMNFLLDRENNTTSSSGFKPDKGLVLTPPTVWEPNPIAGGF